MSCGGFHYQQGDYRLEAIKGAEGAVAVTVGPGPSAQTITIPLEQAARLLGWLNAALDSPLGDLAPGPIKPPVGEPDMAALRKWAVETSFRLMPGDNLFDGAQKLIDFMLTGKVP